MKKYFAMFILAGAMFAGSANAAVFVRFGPPPPVYIGARGYAPGPGYVWVDGYHEYLRRRYVWREGYWARPPYPRAVWVAPYWAPRRGGYEFVRGYWRR